VNVCDRSRLVLPSRAFTYRTRVLCSFNTIRRHTVGCVWREGCVDDGNGDVELTAGGLPKRNFFFFFPPVKKIHTCKPTFSACSRFRRSTASIVRNKRRVPGLAGAFCRVRIYLWVGGHRLRTVWG